MHLSTYRQRWTAAAGLWTEAFTAQCAHSPAAADLMDAAAEALDKADRGGWSWSPLAWVLRDELITHGCGWIDSNELHRRATSIRLADFDREWERLS